MEKKVKEAVRPVGIIWFISVLCYLPLIAKGLTNSVDGLWASSYYQSGNQELGSGRWALLFLDKARDGYAAEPFSSLIALLLISIAAYIGITMFMEMKPTYYIYAMLFTCSVTICCFLAYRFTSINYCFAVVTSFLSVLLLTKTSTDKKQKLIYNLGSIALLVVSIGIYQVSLGCFCSLTVLYMMKLLLDENNEECLSVLKKAIVIFIISCLLYKAAWEICMRARHIVASGYNGADSVSVFGIILGLPHSIGLIYSSWFSYFSFQQGNYILSPVRVLITIVVFAFVIALGVKRLSKNPKCAAIYVILCLIIPVAANVAVILAPSTKRILMQMSEPMALALPLFLCFIDGYKVTPKYLLGILSGVLLYGNIFAVGTDIDALAQGSNSSYAIMNSITTTLAQENLLSDDYKYAFFGNISENELFKTNELYSMANNYAQFGTLLTKPDMVHKAYIGLVDDIGLNLEIVDNDEYLDIYDDGIIEKMPSYPASGSIVLKDGVVIIKVSDDYKYGN